MHGEDDGDGRRTSEEAGRAATAARLHDHASAGGGVTDRRGCRARPGPVLTVEAFLGEHPGAYRPDELAAALPGGIEPSAVAEVVSYLLAVGRAALDDEGYLVRPD